MRTRVADRKGPGFVEQHTKSARNGVGPDGRAPRAVRPIRETVFGRNAGHERGDDHVTRAFGAMNRRDRPHGRAGRRPGRPGLARRLRPRLRRRLWRKRLGAPQPPGHHLWLRWRRLRPAPPHGPGVDEGRTAPLPAAGALRGAGDGVRRSAATEAPCRTRNRLIPRPMAIRVLRADRPRALAAALD